MSTGEILQISTATPTPKRLWGCFIDSPKAGEELGIYAMNVRGWVLGRTSRAVSVELMKDGIIVQAFPVDICRPDIAAVYKQVGGAERSGFRGAVSLVGMKAEFELTLRAVLEDGSRVLLGSIRARREPLCLRARGRPHPLMVTTLGRTGSTWLMRLLGQHPRITTYRPFQYEPRVATYWLEILTALSEPASYLRPIGDADKSKKHWWLGTDGIAVQLALPERRLQDWMGRTSIETLATFCQERIAEFYEQVASIQGQTEPAYFAEKYFPNQAPALMWELDPQAREIFLVRDFRDMVASIFAFNAKRGYVDFGRQHVENDSEYIVQMRGQALRLLKEWKSRSTRSHLLRYEDLILHPVETTARMLDYLNIDASKGTVDTMLRKASERIPEMEIHRTSRDSEESIGRWRRDLDNSLQAACQEAFGDVLKEFGYTLA